MEEDVLFRSGWASDIARTLLSFTNEGGKRPVLEWLKTVFRYRARLAAMKEYPTTTKEVGGEGSASCCGLCWARCGGLHSLKSYDLPEIHCRNCKWNFCQDCAGIKQAAQFLEEPNPVEPNPEQFLEEPNPEQFPQSHHCPICTLTGRGSGNFQRIGDVADHEQPARGPPFEEDSSQPAAVPRLLSPVSLTKAGGMLKDRPVLFGREDAASFRERLGHVTSSEPVLPPCSRDDDEDRTFASVDCLAIKQAEEDMERVIAENGLQKQLYVALVSALIRREGSGQVGWEEWDKLDDPHGSSQWGSGGTLGGSWGTGGTGSLGSGSAGGAGRRTVTVVSVNASTVASASSPSLAAQRPSTYQETISISLEYRTTPVGEIAANETNPPPLVNDPATTGSGENSPESGGATTAQPTTDPPPPATQPCVFLSPSSPAAASPPPATPQRPPKKILPRTPHIQVDKKSAGGESDTLKRVIGNTIGIVCFAVVLSLLVGWCCQRCGGE